MSYDKTIEIQPKYLSAYGVPPILHDLKTCLPKGNKEPEPKILLKSPKSFNKIRALFRDAENAFMIPGQIWTDKNPLVSILLDTKEFGFPTAEFAHGNHSFRFRYELDPKTGEMTQRDYNEKSAMKLANVIGGCADRDERELEVPMDQSLADGYEALKEKYRALNDLAYCDDVPFDNLHVLGGYTAARTEYGFAVKHPRHDVMFVFEACEDIFETYTHDMALSLSHLYEFEFEPRQVWGELPKHVDTPDAFKEFLYSSMRDIRDHICMAIGGAEVNANSKADYVKDNLSTFYSMEDLTQNMAPFSNRTMNEMLAFYAGSKNELRQLSELFKPLAQGRMHLMTSEQFSLSLGDTLQNTLDTCSNDIYRNAARLHREKLLINEDMILPCAKYVASGSNVIDFQSRLSASYRPAISKPVAQPA